MTNLTVNKFIL